MKLSHLVLIAISCIQVNLSGQQKTLLKNVQVIDVIDAKLSTADVLIDGNLISNIGQNLSDTEATVIEGNQRYLIPGLVDAHIHLFQSGGIYTRPDFIDLRKHRSYDEERNWLKDRAGNLLKRYLRSGITTVIDVGGPMYNYDLRDKYKNAQEYPNLLITGPLVSTYQPEEFKIEDSPIIKVNTAEEARALVRKQIPFRPDFIKIWYINLPQLTAESTYDIIEATIDESHKNDLPVAVHATELNTAKLAIKAGADILVHSVAQPIDDEFIEMVKKEGVVLIPTLSVHGNSTKVLGQTFKPSSWDYKFADPLPLGSMLDYKHLQDSIFAQYKNYAQNWQQSDLVRDPIRSANLKMMINQGAKIATGTDAGNIGTHHVSSYFQEIEMMKAAGMTNAEILKASTYNGAVVLAQQNKIGSISEGKMADLILLDQNPLDDIMNISNPSLVIKGGKVYEPNDILVSSPEDLAQEQLNAYNNRDIEAFLAPYSEDVKIFNFPNELVYQGKDLMRERYGQMFEKTPNLHCELVKRIINGNTVIDEELVSGFQEGKKFHATAIYKIENHKIVEVYFISG